jgi:hypothetical protein
LELGKYELRTGIAQISISTHCGAGGSRRMPRDALGQTHLVAFYFLSISCVFFIFIFYFSLQFAFWVLYFYVF